MSSVLENLVNQPYQHGFVTDIESDTAPKGLNEDTIRFISAKKNEPEWLLEWRLKAYRLWLTMKEPTWQNVKYDPINYQDIKSGRYWLVWAEACRQAMHRAAGTVA